MARPRKIPWDRRVQIFLDYRRLQKVYPTARAHKIARSTVTAIVNEFRAAGFAPAARPALSSGMLTLAQELHLSEVVAQLGEPLTLDLSEPSRSGRAGLEPEDALHEDALEKIMSDPFRLSDSLVWHLRGTPAEEAVQEGRKAVGDYNQRCLALWWEIRSGLEDSCKLPVCRYAEGKDETPDKPHIFHGLVDMLYQALWSGSPPPAPPPAISLDWDTGREDPDVLIARSNLVAVGSSTDQEAVKCGTKKFLAENEETLHGRAGELTRLYDDLAYLKDIVGDQFDRVTKDDVCKGICPACPYPEGEIGSRSNDGEV